MGEEYQFLLKYEKLYFLNKVFVNECHSMV
ncbi:MAG: hypothetical protein K0R90_479 [Oscillospiraceae bacterium]|jgi:hypothetical protein|nr:hypothetical protein [Oscillospiraceae bacterium]